MSDQTKCSRCGDWISGYEEHDFQHLEERKVEALERIAEALSQKPPTYVLNSLFGDIPLPTPIQAAPVDARAKTARTHDL